MRSPARMRCLPWLFIVSSMSATHAGEHHFVEIARANTSEIGVDFTTIDGDGVSLSPSGEVAFFATESDGTSGVYRATPGTIVRVSDNGPGGTLPFAAHQGVPDLNAAGQVAFCAIVAGVPGFYRADGTTVDVIESAFFTSYGVEPTITEFGAVYVYKNGGVYSGTGGGVTFPAYTAGDGHVFGVSGGVDVNALGDIAFLGTRAPEGCVGLFRGPTPSAPVTKIAGLCDGFFTSLQEYSLADDGFVAFSALDGISEGVYTSDGLLVSTAADTLGPLLDVYGSPSLSAGALAFTATTDAGPSGLLLGPDPTADRIVRTGDILFGRNVATVHPLRRHACNNLGQVAFLVALDNADVVVVRADPGAPCDGDLDNDRDVDLSDLGLLLSDYGCSSASPTCSGDADRDNDTDLSDLGIVLAAFGVPCP